MLFDKIQFLTINLSGFSMKIFKALTITALLASPMLASAATTTVGTLGAGTVLSASSFDSLGNGGSLVTASAGTNISDTWTLTVEPGYKADISFANNPLTVSALQIWNISGLTVTPAASLTNLTGTTVFGVTGLASGIAGGAYSVGTVVSSVPVPAAAWLMGSALVGFASLGRRKG